MKKLFIPVFAIALVFTSCGSEGADKEAVIAMAAESLEEEIGIYSEEYAGCLLEGIMEMSDVSWGDWKKALENDGNLADAPGVEDISEDDVLAMAFQCMQETNLIEELLDDDNGFSEDAMKFGDDPYLDELYIACGEGDDAACETLYWDSPLGSEYEEFGLSCGGRWDC